VAAPPVIFDRNLIRHRRDRAARLGPSDFLLKEAASDLADRLVFIKRRFERGLVLGGYNGELARRLAGHPSIGSLATVELSPRLIEACPPPRIRADEETMPLAPASLDLVVSALSLQLVNDLPGTLLHVREALRPDGLFIAALLGGRSLHELRAAFIEAESELRGGASPRVAPFADVRDLGALLQRAGFALPVADSDTLTVAYETPLHLMRDLRAMGASNPLAERSRVPVTRTLVFRAADIYQRRFARADGKVLATFEIVALTAWAPDVSQQKPLAPGSARTRLADALGTAEERLPRRT